MRNLTSEEIVAVFIRWKLNESESLGIMARTIAKGAKITDATISNLKKGRAVDELSAHFLAPTSALKLVYRRVLAGDFARLAWAFDLTVFEAARRVAESSGLPLVAVRPHEILVGGDPYEWGDELQLRQIAREVKHGKWNHPEIRGVQAVDERSLVLLWADK